MSVLPQTEALCSENVLVRTRRGGLAYSVTGSGPTLVLLHGMLHTREAWDPVIERLSRCRTVIAVDLPHHGESEPVLDGPGMFEEIRQRVYEFVSALAISEPVHVAGNSLGGFIALDLAARGVVASATVLSPAGFSSSILGAFRIRVLFSCLRRVARRIKRGQYAMLENRLIRSLLMSAMVAHPRRVPAELARTGVENAAGSALLDHLREVPSFPATVDRNVPVTVAWGTRDVILPIRDSRRVRMVFPQVETITLQGAGHVPMSDCPELVAAVLIAGSSPSVARAVEVQTAGLVS